MAKNWMEALEERAEIEFPYPLDEDDFKGLMRHVAEHGPAYIDYSIINNRVASGMPGEDETYVHDEDMCLKAEGNLQTEEIFRDRDLNSTKFRGTFTADELMKISSIKFEPDIPHPLEEQPQGWVEAWDITRRAVENYFSQR